MMEKPSKIVLYMSNTYPCKIGGMEIYNYYLIKELARTEEYKRITVLSLCGKLVNEIENVLPQKDNLFRIRRYGLSTISTILYYCFSNKISWKRTKVIYLPYTDFSYNAFAILVLKKLLKTEYVVHIHGGGLGLLKGRPRWLFNSFFKNAKNIAGVSHPIIEEYTKRTGRVVQYLPPLLPLQESKEDKGALRKAKGFEMFEKIILFVGSIKELKSPDTLLRAFVELGDHFISQHKLGLIMVGDGPLRSQLERKYANVNSIVFEGPVPNEQVKDYYKIADIYAITSWFEGTSISLLEAMFNKLPCIGTNVSGIKEIIEPGINGYLIEKDDSNGLSQVINEIISDYDNAKIRGNNAFHYYQAKFNYKAHLSEVIEFIGR